MIVCLLQTDGIVPYISTDSSSRYCYEPSTALLERWILGMPTGKRKLPPVCKVDQYMSLDGAQSKLSADFVSKMRSWSRQSSSLLVPLCLQQLETKSIGAIGFIAII
jgi:hypothetical protein